MNETFPVGTKVQVRMKHSRIIKFGRVINPSVPTGEYVAVALFNDVMDYRLFNESELSLA